MLRNYFACHAKCRWTYFDEAKKDGCKIGFRNGLPSTVLENTTWTTIESSNWRLRTARQESFDITHVWPISMSKSKADTHFGPVWNPVCTKASKKCLNSFMVNLPTILGLHEAIVQHLDVLLPHVSSGRSHVKRMLMRELRECLAEGPRGTEQCIWKHPVKLCAWIAGWKLPRTVLDRPDFIEAIVRRSCATFVLLILPG